MPGYEFDPTNYDTELTPYGDYETTFVEFEVTIGGGDDVDPADTGPIDTTHIPAPDSRLEDGTDEPSVTEAEGLSAPAAASSGVDAIRDEVLQEPLDEAAEELVEAASHLLPVEPSENAPAANESSIDFAELADKIVESVAETPADVEAKKEAVAHVLEDLAANQKAIETFERELGVVDVTSPESAAEAAEAAVAAQLPESAEESAEEREERIAGVAAAMQALAAAQAAMRESGDGADHSVLEQLNSLPPTPPESLTAAATTDTFSPVDSSPPPQIEAPEIPAVPELPMDDPHAHVVFRTGESTVEGYLRHADRGEVTARLEHVEAASTDIGADLIAGFMDHGIRAGATSFETVAVDPDEVRALAEVVGPEHLSFETPHIDAEDRRPLVATVEEIIEGLERYQSIAEGYEVTGQDVPDLRRTGVRVIVSLTSSEVIASVRRRLP